MEKLNKILCEILRLTEDDLKDDLSMSNVQRWDSLTHMDLVTSIEDELNIQLSMDDIMNMTDIGTVRSIVGSLI
ncbi:acyl carrier protein [bacterium]|nr:acyl carrier protein [bacterium]